MLIIPAIDIKDGHCVRLKQGDMADAMAVLDVNRGDDQHAYTGSVRVGMGEKSGRRMGGAKLGGAA